MVQVIVIYPNSLNAGFEKQGSLFCVYLWGEKDTWTTPFRCMVHRTQRWCLHVHISSSSSSKAASSHHIAQSSRLLCHNCVRQRKQLRYFVDVSLAMHCHKTTSKKEYTKGVQNVHFLKYLTWNGPHALYDAFTCHWFISCYYTAHTQMLTVDRCEHVFVRISTFICTSRPNGSLLSEPRRRKRLWASTNQTRQSHAYSPLVSTRPHTQNQRKLNNSRAGYICTSAKKCNRRDQHDRSIHQVFNKRRTVLSVSVGNRIGDEIKINSCILRIFKCFTEWTRKCSTI